MENWGLVTYRETALLYDPVISSTGNKERVVTVIAHELAHMVGKKKKKGFEPAVFRATLRASPVRERC